MMFDPDVPSITPTWERTLWLTDPGPFVDIAFDLGVTNFVFRAKYHESSSTRQDFRKWIDLYARGRPWRVMWVPHTMDFIVHFDSEHGWKPSAVWRMWQTSGSFHTLRAYVERPPEPGMVLGAFGSLSRRISEPVAVQPGQPHLVGVTGMSKVDAEWSEVAGFVQQLQAEHTEAILHFHGQKSVGRTIGIAARSFDHPVRIGWSEGYPRILLPNGMIWNVCSETSRQQEMWLKLLGASSREVLALDREGMARRTYELNLMSLKWAMSNWDRAWDFRRARDEDEEDIEASDLDWSPKTLPVRLRRAKGEIKDQDRWLCDTCSLVNKCPYSREGSVCIVPDSDAAQLPDMFGTRNAQMIVNGLVNLASVEARRIQHGLAAEEAKRAAAEEEGVAGESGLNPQVTKAIHNLHVHGVNIAKLLDPRLGASASTRVNIGIVTSGGAAAVSASTPQDLTSYIAGELEAQGKELATATEDDVRAILAKAAIETTATEGT